MMPVLYLDVDGVLLSADNLGLKPARGVINFLEWAKKHFEVRWLTSWTLSGKFENKKALAFWLKCPVSFLDGMENPKSWYDTKTEGIDFEDARPWVWIEDGILREESELLSSLGMLDRYIHNNCFEDEDALIKTKEILKKRFSIVEEESPPPVSYKSRIKFI